MTDYVETANTAIEAIEQAAERLAIATRTEMELEDQRPLMKTLAIRRLMGMENPETQKPHSASSAEKLVEADPEYSAHRARQAAAVVETIKARGAYEAQRRRADLAVAMSEVSIALGGPR